VNLVLILVLVIMPVVIYAKFQTETNRKIIKNRLDRVRNGQ
jgi:hypothetical protein